MALFLVVFVVETEMFRGAARDCKTEKEKLAAFLMERNRFPEIL